MPRNLALPRLAKYYELHSHGQMRSLHLAQQGFTQEIEHAHDLPLRVAASAPLLSEKMNTFLLRMLLANVVTPTRR